MTDTDKKAGRPSKYSEELCEKVIELGRQGYSLAAMAGKLEVSRNTLYSWADLHDTFKDALARAKALEQLWWEEEGRRALTADKYQQQIWIKSVQSRFQEDYTERKELSGRGGQPIEVVMTAEDEGL